VSSVPEQQTFDRPSASVASAWIKPPPSSSLRRAGDCASSIALRLQYPETGRRCREVSGTSDDCNVAETVNSGRSPGRGRDSPSRCLAAAQAVATKCSRGSGSIRWCVLSNGLADANRFAAGSLQTKRLSEPSRSVQQGALRKRTPRASRSGSGDWRRDPLDPSLEVLAVVEQLHARRRVNDLSAGGDRSSPGEPTFACPFIRLPPSGIVGQP
jgi:hypothetical protein